MRSQRVTFIGVMTLVLLIYLIGSDGGNSVTAAASADIVVSETKYVALTFDDGPRAETTGRLLDGLRERGANATFFLVGNRIEKNKELVCRMKAEGHQVGNHTWDHTKLQGASDETLKREITETDNAIRELLGDGSYWVRPPYGLIDEHQKKLFSTPLVHWSVDPKDWEVLNCQKVTAAVVKKVKPGSIILLHDFYPTSVDAAFQIIDQLQQQGYVFVTVEELLALYGVEPENGRFYTNAICN